MSTSENKEKKAKDVAIDAETQEYIDSFNKEGAFLDPIELVLDCGTRVAFSKAMLARASPVFRGPLETGADDPWPIKGTSPRALIHFLRILDVGKSCIMSLAMVKDALLLAHMLDATMVIDKCILNVENRVEGQKPLAGKKRNRTDAMDTLLLIEKKYADDRVYSTATYDALLSHAMARTFKMSSLRPATVDRLWDAVCPKLGYRGYG